MGKHRVGAPPAEKEDDVATTAQAAIEEMAHDIETNKGRLARSRALVAYVTRLLTGKSRSTSEQS